MAKSEYLTAPEVSTKMPKGIGHILTNEATERFAFYGLASIQTVFMVNYLTKPGGEPANLSEEKALVWIHLFKAVVYFLPLLGALISDIFLGKFRTIIIFSVLYCVGFVVTVLDQSYIGIAVGWSLIALGTGLIKACVSANVGDQFGKDNKHLISKVYGWFYFSINLGAFISTALVPIVLDKYGPKVAFGVPGVFMMIAVAAYLTGRKKFVHVPAGGVGFIKETFSAEGLKVVAKLFFCIYIFVAVFWALFDQTPTKWVLQAENMDMRFMGITLLPSQVQAVNPLLVMVMIPLFQFVIYPAMGKVFKVTPLRKIGIGFFIGACAFAVSAWIESRIVAGFKPNIGWQIVAYIIITAAEVMISITVLEFSYTQAPPKMKSFISSVSLLSISLGNVFVMVVNKYIQNPDGTSKLEGADYYWFFVKATIVTAVVFAIVTFFYREKTYIQGETEDLQ